MLEFVRINKKNSWYWTHEKIGIWKSNINGHEMNEFVPQRTAAYISQHDVHIGEIDC